MINVMQELITFLFSAVSDFLMSEPIIYFVGLTLLLFAVRILFILIGRRKV